jgi:hypothetical protein
MKVRIAGATGSLIFATNQFLINLILVYLFHLFLQTFADVQQCGTLARKVFAFSFSWNSKSNFSDGETHFILILTLQKSGKLLYLTFGY